MPKRYCFMVFLLKRKSDSMALFGTNGVRGKLDVLTPALAYSLCASFAATLPKGKVVLARDMRLTGPMIHASAAAGLMSAGREVQDIGLCSSPVAEYAYHSSGAAGLVIVTASHNPPEWNALKFVDGKGVAVSHERGERIEKLALSGKYPQADWKSAGRIALDPGAAARHAAAVLKNVDSEKIRRRKLRVALDFGNGTSNLSRSVFQSLGCEIIALNDRVDGTFPGRPSEPSEQNVQGLCRAVRKSSADFGVAWDGDSDRVVFVDGKGNWIVGDKGFAISAAQACREKKSQKEKLVVTTVATSKCVEEACAALGAKTIYTAVGAPYLSEKMAELGSRAVSGGEEVGGIIWPDFSLAKDGIYAAAKIAEMCCGRTVAEMVAELPVYFNSKCRIEKVEGRKEKEAGLDAAGIHANNLHAAVMLVDGVRADFGDGWVIVRASGTENVMRVFAEGKTQKRADSLMKEFKDIVEQACVIR